MSGKWTPLTKYSYYDHSMSIEKPLIEFDVDEIENDMTEFLDWISAREKLLK